MTRSADTSKIAEGLFGLTRLARESDVDVRPVLLRVMTDIFVGRASHTAEEIQEFEKIALGLLDRADADTRLIVARKLSECMSIPNSLAEKLVSEGGEAAAAILARSNALPRAWLVTAALGPSAENAAAVASRVDLDAEMCSALVTRPEAIVARALAANMFSPLDGSAFQLLASRATNDPILAKSLCARASDSDDVRPLFLYASHRQRTAILLDARRADLGRTRGPAPDAVAIATAEEIASAAVNRDDLLFQAILARALGVSVPKARALVVNDGGEALALALRSLHVTPEAAAMVFTLALPRAIAQEPARVRALTRIVEEVSPTAARAIVDAMLGGVAPAPARAPRHVPATDIDAKPTPSRPVDFARPLANVRKRSGMLFARGG